MTAPVTKQKPATEDHSLHALRQRAGSPLGVLVLLLITTGCGLGVWRLFFYSSPASKGLQVLQTAYRAARPLESRFSGFSYAPFVSLRGEQTADDTAHTLAARFLFEDGDKNLSAELRHSRGVYYLAERKYDRAISEFEAALQANAESASLHNDLGAALLEKGRNDAASDEDGRKVEFFAQSLAHLNRALKLDPDLHEAIFNRALLREQMMLTEGATEDWRAYLEKDPNSSWSEEVREHLTRLEERKRRTEQVQQNLVEDFLNAYRAGDAEHAWILFSPNRQRLTTELLTTYLKSDAEATKVSRREALDALAYAGELDAQRAGDRYAADAARFYHSLSRKQLIAASQANDSLRRGRADHDVPKLKEAVIAYDNAQRLFAQMGNRCGARLATFWLGLCYWELSQTSRSQEIWETLAEDCRADQHLWLHARTLNMLSGAAFKSDEYSQAIAFSRKARELADQINDLPGVFSADSALIEYYRLIGNRDECMAQIGRGLSAVDNAAIGIIPLWRYYDIAAMAYNTFGLYDAAIDYERESLYFAIAADSFAQQAVSHANLGLMYGKQRDFDAAFKHTGQAYEIAAAHASEVEGQLHIAFAAVQMGHLHRERGEFAQALTLYDQAIELHGTNSLDFSIHLYQAYRGRLVCYMARKETAAAQQQLDVLLGVMDKHRAKIIEEENRNSFFAAEQSIYDLGIALAYSQMQDSQKAFEYAEASRSRSLLDSMGAVAQVINRDGKLDLLLQAATHPLPLAEIKAHIPDDARMLYYAVLEDKLLIWVVSRVEAHSVEVKISQAELTDSVTKYLSAVNESMGMDREETMRLARELYGHLIAPVESLLGGSHRLYIVPDKIIYHLPWDALISPDSGRFVVEDYRITLSPSATLFAKCTDLADQKAGARAEHVTSIGDPSFDPDSFPDLEPLRDALREARAIAALYPSSSLLSGSAAREQSVRDELAKADVAHFALHCVVNERSAMRSTLVLAKEPASGANPQAYDGRLQAYEIYDMKLPRTRLALLSACQTGVERYYSGEGMIGMARAFLVARVPLVVASLWPVDSEATAELMIRFHQYRKRDGGMPIDEALRRAKCDLLQGSVERYRRPTFWAAFQTIGGHAEF